MSEEIPYPRSPPGARRRATRGKKPPPRISEADFLEAAKRHLERFPCSEAGLRRVLERRARRSRLHHGDDGNDRDEVGVLIRAVTDRLLALGLLDDRRYGQALITRLRARGASLRRIAARLHEKGIPSQLRDELLSATASPESELSAALTCARRRRLGNHRLDSDKRQEMRERDLGALGRAGFSFEIATQVLDEEPDS